MVKQVKKSEIEMLVSVLTTLVEWNGDPDPQEADDAVVVSVGSYDLTYGELMSSLRLAQDIVRYKQINIVED